ncbi:MAG: hypothetical protein P8J27_11905 [Mariniblastus sp.]|nr:hypothetical protein [Mariniblastus sp.]
MDDRFQNLIRQRQTKLAWILLGLFWIALLAVDRLAYPLLRSPDGPIMEFISLSIIGIVPAQFILLAIWTVLGEGTLGRRLLFLSCTFAAIISAWMLGLIASFGEDYVSLKQRREVLIWGLLPVLFLSLCTPLAILKTFFKRKLSLSKDSPVQNQTTISGLMMITSVVAISLASPQVLLMSEFTSNDQNFDFANFWFFIGILSGASFLIGLIIVLPTTLILFSTRRNFLISSAILFVATALLTAGAISQILNLWSGAVFWNISQVKIQPVLSAMLTVITGIAIMRMFGFRLRSTRSQADG